MDDGHDDCSKTYVGGGWKDAARSICWIFIFLTLSPSPPPPVLIRPLPYGRTSFFASRHPCQNEAAALFFLLDHHSSRSFPRNNTRRKLHDDVYATKITTTMIMMMMTTRTADEQYVRNEREPRKRAFLSGNG